YGHQAEAIMAKYDKLRYRLIPYIYSQAKKTYDTGAPFMRPLWMDFPNDPNVADIGTEYMFGPAFLVAPVTDQGQTEKDVYLPAGSDWYNFWTNEKLAGGRWVKVAAPIDQIRVYPGRDAHFALYEDDGSSYGYAHGHYSRIPMDYDNATGVLTLGKREGDGSGTPAKRQFIIRRIGAAQPNAGVPDGSRDQRVEYDGHEVKVSR